MRVIETVSVLRPHIRSWQIAGQRVALVPTMGNLHEGHLQLIREARARADKVVVSIFVNPMQFERADDLAGYPRTLAADCEKLISEQVDLLFAPTPQEVYPNGLADQTRVDVHTLSGLLEGASRPGHFQGVATVVSKLFNLVQPDIACFGEKDFQQLAIIRRMVSDLNYPVTIIGVPTQRDENGLALSSRNGLLPPDAWKQASRLYHVMQSIAQGLEQGKPAETLLVTANTALEEAGFKPDNLAICDAGTLQPLTQKSEHAVILMAAWLHNVRLIDNQQVILPARTT